MENKFKHIDKEFLLTDSTVNSYGFRLLTAGYLMSEFEKNPVGYYMHERKDGVLVRWSDFRKDGDKVFAKANINLAHPRGQRTVDEIENGFLNAASCGHFVVMEMEANPSSPLPNQTGPDVTKWYNREASLVDIPGNYNALTELFDKDGHAINLADFTNKPTTMKSITLTATMIAGLNLKADAPETEVNAAFENLVAQAGKVPGLEQQLAAANTAKKTAEDKVATIEKAAAETTINNLLADAQKEGKVTVALSAKLKVDYAENPTGLKDLLAAMPKYEGLVAKIDEEGTATEIKDLSAKSWSELDKAGKLERLKELDLSAFKTKFKEEYKREYTA